MSQVKDGEQRKLWRGVSKVKKKRDRGLQWVARWIGGMVE